jgi:hypothetical protein
MCHVGSLAATYQVGSRIFTPLKKKNARYIINNLIDNQMFSW